MGTLDTTKGNGYTLTATVSSMKKVYVGNDATPTFNLLHNEMTDVNNEVNRLSNEIKKLKKHNRGQWRNKTRLWSRGMYRNWR